MTKQERFIKSYNYYKDDIEKNYSSLYEFIDFTYEKDKSKNRNKGVITVRHKICGHEFKRVACAWKTNKSCQFCSNMRSVSLLHATMCSYANKLFKNCEIEYDIGFTGENNGVSKYDLFIPNYNGNKTLFEFQSRYHDNKNKFDCDKKNFAENLGYILIQLDCRDITPIEAVYFYFGVKININDLHNQKDFIRDYDLNEVQKLLDKNLSVNSISTITGISKNIINHWMKTKILEQRADRKQVLYGKTPVVQLDLLGNFIKEFDSGWQVYKELGFKVDSCVSGKTRHCHGFLFIKKYDYESNNYSIPKKIRIFNKS